MFPSEIRNGILILGYPLSISKVGFFLLHFKHLEIQFQIQASTTLPLQAAETLVEGDSSCLKISMHIIHPASSRHLSVDRVNHSEITSAISIDCRRTKDKRLLKQLTLDVVNPPFQKSRAVLF